MIDDRRIFLNEGDHLLDPVAQTKMFQQKQLDAELDFEEFSEHQHFSQRSPALRAAILGANDGLVSTACLMLGVLAGGDGALHAMVLSGVACLVAGALSMALGEYVSVASQLDAEDADLERETAEFKKSPLHARREQYQLARLYELKGLSRETADKVAEELHANKDIDAIVKIHLRDELGIDPDEFSNPIQASWLSAVSFAVGAALPLLAGAFIIDFVNRIIVICVVSGIGLFMFGVVGGILGGASRRRTIVAGLRVLLGGLTAMGLTFAAGLLFEKVTMWTNPGWAPPNSRCVNINNSSY